MAAVAPQEITSLLVTPKEPQPPWALNGNSLVAATTRQTSDNGLTQNTKKNLLYDQTATEAHKQQMLKHIQ